ncbi:hypothetical protein F5Y04DRAFT_127420 [Hypomontagnella monticulosa]|nr:hypothetical protein F5Y04DRAFT_127420 [Hypomontagnella monticulosa]
MPTSSGGKEKPTLTTVPHEVAVNILECCHDLDSLLSLIASCRYFYSVFHTYQISIMHTFISREIDPAVLPEAVQASKAAEIYRRGPSFSALPFAVSELFGEGRGALVKDRWSLADGIAAIRLHSIIDRFASELAFDYLIYLKQNSCQEEREGPPSTTELARIKRALYRFEVFCRLFPPVDDCKIPQENLHFKLRMSDKSRSTDPDFRAAQVSFISFLSLWEREQLYSVYESLWRQVVPAFNDISFHDLGRTSFEYSYPWQLGNNDIECILSRGLRGIYNISRAKTLTERRKVLGPDFPDPRGEFLHDAFRRYHSPQMKLIYLATDYETFRQQYPPFYNDSDPSPEIVFRWAHNLEDMWGAGNWIHIRSRANGYVFWDKERIDGTRFLWLEWIDTQMVTEGIS